MNNYENAVTPAVQNLIAFHTCTHSLISSHSLIHSFAHSATLSQAFASDNRISDDPTPVLLAHWR